MYVLPAFRVLRPISVEAVLAAKLDHPGSRLVGGGTDLIVNLRRGIGEPPPALIDVNAVDAIKAIEVCGDRFRVGAAVKLDTLAAHPEIGSRFAALAQSASSVAGPTQRNMGTVGGNLCLDTRCIFYNQSEWWRAANDYCLKHRGSKCHVAPGSSICYATFSGDLAAALQVLEGEVEIIGAAGQRTIAVDGLYTRDGERYLSLGDDEFVVAVSGRLAPGLASGYDKMRVRRSIEFPLAGVAVVVGREREVLTALRVAVTGTNPWPIRVEGTDALCGAALDEAVIETLDGLMRRQVMALKTTFTSGHYRRRVAGVLARRLVRYLYDVIGNA